MKDAWRLLTALTYAFIYAPIVIVAIYSFNQSRFGSGWKGFTVRWYATLLHDDRIVSAAWNSLVIASCSTFIAVVLGTPLGIGLARCSFRFKKVVEAVMYVPMVVSDLVIAVALVSFYSWVRAITGHLDLGFATVILAHVTFQIPFVALVVRARAANLDPRMEEAARDLGASALQTARYITIPLLLPAIISATLLAFTLSVDDFVVSFFTTGPGSTTLPVLIYSSVKRGITPDINAASTILICISLLLTVSSIVLQRRAPGR